MTLDELNEIKAQVKAVLSELGYKRWEKHLIKCLTNMPMREARKEIESKANEIAQTEQKLIILHAMGGQ